MAFQEYLKNEKIFLVIFKKNGFLGIFKKLKNLFSNI